MERVGIFLERLTSFFIALVVGFLGLRFVLRLLGANANNGFVDWVYDTSAELLEPFRGIFPATTIEPGYVLEFSTLFAMLVYALVGYLILALIDALTPDRDDRVVKETVKKRKK